MTSFADSASVLLGSPIAFGRDLKLIGAYLVATSGLFAIDQPVAWLMVFTGAVAYIGRHYAEVHMRRKYGRLANQTRKIQAQDALDAFLRVFDRSQLKDDDLRTLDEVLQSGPSRGAVSKH